MMSARERVEAALQHCTPDRTPIFEYVLLSPIADRLLGRIYAGDPANWDALVKEAGWEAAVRRNAVDRVELAQRLGHDMLYVYPPPPPCVPEVAPPGPSVTAHTASPTLAHDPVATLRERNDQAAQTSPPGDDQYLVYLLIQEEMRLRDLDLPILAPAYAHGVWTDTDLMQTMVLAPEVAAEHFALATRRALAAVDRYIALGIDQIGVGGDFAGTRPIISPRAYRRFILPEVRTVAQRIHAAGRYAVNASDGNLWPVIDDFLLGAEVDGYLEIDVHAGMDLRRLKAGYGDRITFYGNLDCGNVLSFGSEEMVRRHVIECLEAGMGDGGHILCASNAIAASVPLVNYLALVNAYREYFAIRPLKWDTFGTQL